MGVRGFAGPQGTSRQKGKLAHRILRLVAMDDGLTQQDLALVLDMSAPAVRGEVRILKGAGLLRPRYKTLRLTQDGEQAVLRLGLRR